MNTVVIDIETVPIDFDSFDDTTKAYLLKTAENAEDEERIKQEMALWAPTNRIVAIGVLGVESGKGAMFFQSPEIIEPFEENGIQYMSTTEKWMLENFWETIAPAHKFVTFNGRGFDCPVLMLRSAMLGVKPTKNLMPYRYSSEQHIDLLDQLTFYGAIRKFNLRMFCQVFGIPSSKDGMKGSDVARVFKEGKALDIARYCAGDLFATRELYLKWKEYLV